MSKLCSRLNGPPRPLQVALGLLLTLALSLAGVAQAAGPTAPQAQPELWFATEQARVLVSTPLDGATGQPSLGLRQRLDLAPLRVDGGRFDTPAAGDHATVIRAAELSSNGRWLALQIDRGPRPSTWVVATDPRSSSAPRPLVSEASGFFLGWHPDGERVLLKALDLDIADPGLWLVDVVEGSHQVVELPGMGPIEGLMSAAISPDGSTLAYAFTHGLGYGSELWLKDLSSQRSERLMRHDHGVVGTLSWSPDGRSLAYDTLYDSPVPFAEAGLFVYDLDQGASRYLTQMDGGHGEQALWTADGESLVYIARDNSDDVLADNDPTALISSLRRVRVANGLEEVLVPADGARQVDLRRGPDGGLLFVSNRGGSALEVWAFDPGEARARQLTDDGLDKRHPVLTSTPANPAASR